MEGLVPAPRQIQDLQKPVDVNKPHKAPNSDSTAEVLANGDDSSTPSPAVEPMQSAAPDAVMSDVADAADDVSMRADSATPQQQHSSADPAAVTDADQQQQQQQHTAANPSEQQLEQSAVASTAEHRSPHSPPQQQQRRLGKLPSWVKRLQDDRSDLHLFTKAGAVAAAAATVAAATAATAAIKRTARGDKPSAAAADTADDSLPAAAAAAADCDRTEADKPVANPDGSDSGWLTRTFKRPRIAGPAAAATADNHQQQQQHADVHKQHLADHSHVRKHHAIDDDLAASNRQQQQQGLAAAAARDSSGQQQQRREAGHLKRPSKQAKGLLSFQDDDGDDDATGLHNQYGSSDDSDRDSAPGHKQQQQQQQQRGSLGAATANRFKQEAKQAAAAARSIFKFKPSSSSGGGAAAAGSSDPAAAVGGSSVGGLVDDDGDLRSAAAAAAGLSQVHFGFATARGHRPYMEDRHTIITSLNPSSAAAAALAAAEDVPAAAAAAANGSSSSAPAAAAAGGRDGVGRSYAAIFDGHNGAGAAETAARKLHLLLASHPALKIYRGDPGPPATVKQEEYAVGQAMKAAFRQVDDLVLGVARRDGTRDGATALVVLRLGHALYAAHAGDSRAVLCRDAAAYRLTEDHKPHLPQERSRIEEAGGRVDFQRCWRVVIEPRDGRPGSGLAVSRSLGDLDFKEPQRFVECDPDVTRLLLLPARDTFVVLGSDGLWDVLSDTDAVITAATALRSFAADLGSSSNPTSVAATTIHTGSGGSGMRSRFRPGQFNLGLAKQAGANADLPDNMVYSDAAATAAAEALLAESMRRGTMDNVTVIVMLLQWS